MSKVLWPLAFVASRALAAQDIPTHRIDERATRVISAPGSVDFLALDGVHAWATNRGRVERWSATDSLPTATVLVDRPCGGMSVGFGALWVADCKTKGLTRIALRTPTVVTTIPTGLAEPAGELSVATGAGAVWLLTDSTGVLSRIDPATNRVVAQIRVQPHSYAAAFGFGAVWITTTGPRGATTGSVQRIDPVTNRVVATIAVGPAPRFVAAGEGGVWTLNQRDGTVSRIDPATNRVVATIPAAVPGGGGDIATGAGRVWVRASAVLLQEIDPARNAIVARYGPPAGSGAVRANEHHVWVTAHDTRRVWVLPPP